MGDPIGAGGAASLARPGGTVTGLAHQSSDLHTKRLQLLKEVIPGLSRVVFLYDEHLRKLIGDFNSVKAAEAAAGALGLTAFPSAVEHEADFGSAFERAKRGRAQAVLLFGSPLFNGYRQALVDRAIKPRLPIACEEREFVVVGCLVAYGPRYSDMFRRAVTYVDRIVKGAKPADLPIEQPTQFELVINLKTAKALGLTIPPSVLARADEVIQ